MQSTPSEASPSVKKEENDFVGTALVGDPDNSIRGPVLLSSDGEDVDDTSNKDSQSSEVSKQLVLYDPKGNESGATGQAPDPIQYEPCPLASNLPPRVLPAVGAFTVQCANCFKWRLIPTKEKYEEIREHILERPFVCETARAWRPEISCNDAADVEPDGSRLWAIDKPNIAQPPPGWQRELRIRAEGSCKFADVYYIAPSGKRLRSIVEIQKYLMKHPEHTSEGVRLSQFSFQTPKPLHDNYVRKRQRAPLTASSPKPHDLREATPLSWAGPDESTLRLPMSNPGSPVESESRPSKRQASPSSYPIYSNNTIRNPLKIKLKSPNPSTQGAFDL